MQIFSGGNTLHVQACGWPVVPQDEAVRLQLFKVGFFAVGTYMHSVGIAENLSKTLYAATLNENLPLIM